VAHIKDKKRKIPAVFEQMEPRLLFSAGAEAVFVADAMPDSAVLNTAQVQQLVAATTPAGEEHFPGFVRNWFLSIPLHRIINSSPMT